MFLDISLRLTLCSTVVSDQDVVVIVLCSVNEICPSGVCPNCHVRNYLLTDIMLNSRSNNANFEYVYIENE